MKGKLILFAILLMSITSAQVNISAYEKFASLNSNIFYNSSKQSTDGVRDPGHAMLISALWPGLGQFYNGPTESTKGTIMAVAQGGFLLMTIIGAANPTEQSVGNSYYSANVPTGLNPLVWIGLAGMLGNSIYSMIDASNRAKELNEADKVSLHIGLYQLPLASSPGVKFSIHIGI